jgi:hypothetical protein
MCDAKRLAISLDTREGKTYSERGSDVFDY